jgi:YfiH family protein
MFNAVQSKTKSLTPFYSKKLSTGNIMHGFFGREGGMSEGAYSSLNCNPRSSDKAEAVQENLSMVCDYFSLTPRELKTLNQVHSDKVVYVGSVDDVTNNIDADALVTDQPNIMLGVQTADCTPIMIADAENNVVAIMHAGWKGAFSGIIQNTVHAFERCGGDIEKAIAVIGPTIAQKSYEVDQNFYNQFMSQAVINKRYFINSQKEGHYMFDLPKYCFDLLQFSGIKNVENLDIDTYSNPHSLFSYRRACHEQNIAVGSRPVVGGQISVIALVK